MFARNRIRLIAATILGAITVASPASADQISNFPGGYVHSWTGDHGESFVTVHTNNNGQSVTTVNRHDGLGPQPIVPVKPEITKKFGGSLFDPDINKTTTVLRGPTFSGSMIEDGNTLRDHADMISSRYTRPISGAVYDPETDQTSSMVGGAGGWVRKVEDGNTMRDRAGMDMPGKSKSKHSGSVYDPDTNRTTTIIRGPSGSASTIEAGNTLDRHGFMPGR
jgi:uncharacterized protein (DUF2147 family)